MMKHIIVAFFILSFLSCNSPKDNETFSEQGQSNIFDKPLTPNGDTLKVKTCDFFDESSEGGEIRGYYSLTELKKIEVELFSELGKVYKEFINDADTNSFKFKQSYFFYDKPFYEKEFQIIDSVIIEGSAGIDGIHKKVIGNKMSNDEVNKIVADVNLSRKKYTALLKNCNSEKPQIKIP